MKQHHEKTREDEAKKENKEPEKKEEKQSNNKEIQDLTETLKRVQAEFENYKKRCEKENAQYVQYAEQELIRKLLPVLDSFELSIKNIKNAQDPEKFKKGVELIFAQLVSTLQERGLQKIDSAGKEFDPYLHEVLLTEESEKDNMILEELQPGYRFKDKVIRHTKVKIGKQKEKNNEPAK